MNTLQAHCMNVIVILRNPKLKTRIVPILSEDSLRALNPKPQTINPKSLESGSSGIPSKAFCVATSVSVLNALCTTSCQAGGPGAHWDNVTVILGLHWDNGK